MKRFVLAVLLSASIGAMLGARTSPFLTDGPPTPAANLLVVADENNHLVITTAAAGVTDGPPTAFGNIRLVADESNHLVVSCSGCGGAPTNAKYITQTPDATLSAEQALSALATGLMFSTTTTGVVTTIAPTDDNLVVGDGSNWALKALANCTDTGGNHLNYATATNAFSCGTSGGGFTIGDTQVAFASGANTPVGAASFTFNGSTSTPILTENGSGQTTLQLGANTTLASSATPDRISLGETYSDTSATASKAKFFLVSDGASNLYGFGVSIDSGAGAGVIDTFVGGNRVGFFGPVNTAYTISALGSFTTNRHFLNTGTAPTVSSCGTGTVTTGSTDSWGEVTATGATACTVTFNVAYPTIAFCTVEDESTLSTTRISAISASAFTVTGLTSGDKFMYHCGGK